MLKTTKNLASALNNSTSAFKENMRLMPARGFIRSNLGASDLALNSQPPSIIGPTREATSSIANRGASTIRPSCTDSKRCNAMVSVLNSASRSKEKLKIIMFINLRAISGPTINSATAATMTTASVFNSLERATWPLSRDSLRRFAVGSSVFS